VWVTDLRHAIGPDGDLADTPTGTGHFGFARKSNASYRKQTL
jgi:nicotinamide mononucleotide (NMN) deamidase PncC